MGEYIAQLPPIAITGYFGDETRDAVYAFQNFYGLPVDGIVGEQTWNRLYSVYLGLITSLPASTLENIPTPFGGVLLKRGMTLDAVKTLQENLNTLATIYPEIAPVPVTGTFTDATYEDVIAFQRLNGLEENGIVGPIVWAAIEEQATAIANGNLRSEGQYPGNSAS